MLTIMATQITPLDAVSGTFNADQDTASLYDQIGLKSVTSRFWMSLGKIWKKYNQTIGESLRRNKELFQNLRSVFS